MKLDWVPIQAITVQYNTLHASEVIKLERTQYPGMLAWALTVHKAQGDSYDKMVGCVQQLLTRTPKYMCGQIYTMLSRARTRKGLKLIGFTSTAINVNKKALTEMKRLNKFCKLTINHIFTEIPLKDEMTLAFLNIRSLRKHFAEVKKLLDTYTIHYLGLCETNTQNGYQLDIINYNSQTYHEGHGLAFYTLYPIIYHDNFNQGIECSCCVLANQLIVSIYIKPQFSISSKLKLIQDMMTHFLLNIKHLHKIKYTTILGDFNCSYPNDRNQMQLLFNQYGLKQHVYEPTHINGGTLDLCFTDNNISDIALYPLWFTDHFLLCLKFRT